MTSPALKEPLLLERRLGLALPAPEAAEATPPLVLALTAEERTRLRGRRRSVCGRELLLQLPRGEALVPGEWLAPAAGVAAPPVRVAAAAEPLLVVASDDPRALLQAAYHLGNRHVALEVEAGELRLLDDPVLAQLLTHRGLRLTHCHAPFHPEAGAYGEGHSHGSSQGPR